MIKRTSVLVLTVALALGGCATNTIRLDRASAMGDAGEAAAAGTYAVLEEVDEANREKLIAVAALDPACTLPTPVIASPTRTDAKVCTPTGEPRVAGDFELTRFDARAFEPTVATLEALATYLGAVDAILTKKPVDVGAELDEALNKLHSAAGGIASLVGSGAPPGLNADQQAAVTGAISLVSALVNEARTVEELRRFETPARAAEFAAIIERMRAINDGLADLLGEELQQQQRVLALTRSPSFDPRENPRDPRENRREEMGLIERREDIAALEAALAKALDALATARTDYVALLRDSGAPLTDDERARRSRITHERVIGALSALAKLVRVF